MSGTRNRRKGHNLERDVAASLRNIGFDSARTTRAESNTLDSCGVDIANVPFLIQCKAGYDKRYPRYSEIEEDIRIKLKEAYKSHNPYENLPVILIHKPTRSSPYWSVSEDFMMELLNNYFNNKNELLSKPVITLLKKARKEILDLEENIAILEGNEDISHKVILHSNPIFDEIDQILRAG